MASFTSLFSSIKSAYNNINPSTLTGAIDIIVVKQEDGTLRCTPFHVRFGKLGVLQNHNNKVYITINGTSVEDLYMQLCEAGEAVFIEETTIDSDLSSTRHLEPSDANTFLDPDHALTPGSDTHPQLSNIDCSPQIVNKQLDVEKAQASHQPLETYAYDQAAPAPMQVDVLQSETIVPHSTHHRRVKRRPINRIEQTNQPSSDEENEETQDIGASGKRRSRPRKRVSTPVEIEKNSACHSSDEHANTTPTLPSKRSASENDLPFFQIDDDEKSQSSTPFVDAHSRLNSIDSRQKSLLPLAPPALTVSFQSAEDEEQSYSSSQEDSLDGLQLPMKTTRTLSNPIPIEVPAKPDHLETLEESNPLLSALLSHSAPISTITDVSAPIPIRMNPSNDVATSYYLNEDFSPSTSLPSAASLRPTSPKSDTEYELDKSSQQASITSRTGLGWRWKWGELPEPRRNVFRYLWPSSSSTTAAAPPPPPPPLPPATTATKKKIAPKEGIYLDDITSDKCDDRARYLPQMDYYQNQARSPKDDDQESGKGNSIPQSPVREHEAACPLGDIEISLCGNLCKSSEMTDEIFDAHLISYDAFQANQSILNDPNVIGRIGGKFYDWNVVLALIAAKVVYHEQLTVEAVEQQLQKKQMTTNKARTTSSGSWWPFSSKKLDAHDQYSTCTTTEALAWAMKSEDAPSIAKERDRLRKNSNDSEQEDREVRKITEKMQHPTLATQSSKSQGVKKTMILTSDQLKRLNLKSGMNQIEFSVTTALQGTTIVEANIFFFDHLTKFVISDIDGTITKSDVFGHILPLVGKDWSHDGIAEFFKAIQQNGYQFIYLSARAIGQSRVTRNFLRNIKQCGYALPEGPLLISPDTLVTALYREVIAKRPEDFKIECLKNIASLFPGKNPFYAGFGNRINDQWAYTAVGIPVTRIFTINPRGEVVRQKLSQVLSTSYKNLHQVVDQVFPPMDSFSASEAYSSFTFWREEPPSNEGLEDEMREHLEAMAKRQKSKGKGTTTPTSGQLPKTTPTTALTKSNGEKVLTLAQATENTVKKP